MFSSDPLAPRPAVRPAILDAEQVAAFERGAFANAWMPEHIEASDFVLPELDADPSSLPNGYAASRDPLAALREQARHEAEAAVQQTLAEREAHEAARREQLRAEAYAAGVAAGRAEAEAATRTALAGALEALWLATEEVRAAESRWLGTLQENVAALVAGAARHVVNREVRSDDALVRELAARAVAEFPQDHAVQVRINPDDLATLRAAFAESGRPGELRWIADARVERGGCVVEGRDRIVDGRVDTALERIYRTLGGHHA
jgi:flagellar biosynthesis/type III secretory pathway protein FliH